MPMYIESSFVHFKYITILLGDYSSIKRRGGIEADRGKIAIFPHKEQIIQNNFNKIMSLINWFFFLGIPKLNTSPPKKMWKRLFPLPALFWLLLVFWVLGPLSIWLSGLTCSPRTFWLMVMIYTLSGPLAPYRIWFLLSSSKNRPWKK